MPPHRRGRHGDTLDPRTSSRVGPAARGPGRDRGQRARRLRARLPLRRAPTGSVRSPGRLRARQGAQGASCTRSAWRTRRRHPGPGPGSWSLVENPQESMMRHRRRQRLRGTVTLLALSGASWIVNPPAGAESLLGNGRVLYERDFTRSSRLAATPNDVVLLELEPRGGLHRPGDGSGPGRLREHRARYRLDTGTYTFCLEPNEPAL